MLWLKNAMDWEALGWHIPSISVLVTHLTGAERYWIGDVAGREPSGRVRDEEFKVQRILKSDLKQRLADSFAYSEKLLEPFSIDELEIEKLSIRDGEMYTVSWALLHALEHTAIHLGHIQIIRSFGNLNLNCFRMNCWIRFLNFITRTQC
jgi:hypothetical protein